jgi:hypothetical protein
VILEPMYELLRERHYSPSHGFPARDTYRGLHFDIRKTSAAWYLVGDVVWEASEHSLGADQ